MAAPLAGRTYLVTGATDGIGAHTAQRLAAQGATVLVHGRSEARVEAAVRAAGGTAHGFVADLASLAQVRRLAEEVQQAHPRLDVLIHNAGVYEKQRSLTEVRPLGRGSRRCRGGGAAKHHGCCVWTGG